MAGRIPQGFIDELIAPRRHRRADRRTRAAEESRARVQGLLPVPRREDALVLGQPGQAVLSTASAAARTARALGFLMQYDQLSFPEAVEELAQRLGLEVPREAGQAPKGPREPRGSRTCSVASPDSMPSSSPSNERARQYMRGRGPRAAETLRTVSASAMRRTPGTRCCGASARPRSAARAARDRPHHRARATGAGPGRILRPLPRSRDVPDPRCARPGHRLRRPRDRPRRAEVPQFARDDAVPQGPRALRPVRSATDAPAAEAPAHRRGLHGRRAPAPGGAALRGRDARHGDDGRAPAARVPAGERDRVRLRRRPRRSRGGLARAAKRAARGARRARDPLPVPARGRGSRHARGQGRPRGIRGAPRRRAAAVGIPAGATARRRGYGARGRAGALRRAGAAPAGKAQHRRLSRAADRAHRHRCRLQR